MSTPPRRPTPTTRRGAARRAAASASANAPAASPLVRYRRQLVAGVVVLAVVVGAALFFFQATTPTYACATEFAPTPTASPAPGATQRLGYVEPDLGREHISPGAQTTYGICPPASGKHLNIVGEGPIKPGVFKPGDNTYPQGWIHNLEHGGLVLLYRCSSDACPEYDAAKLKAFYDAFPNGPICGTPKGQIGPIIARFDQMKTAYAALLWGQVLPLDTLDTQKIDDFWAQQGERSNPEKFCAAPSPSPAAS